MKEKINQYLEDTFKEIPSTKQLAELKEEIRSNLLASIEDFQKEGKSEEDAYKMAIERMGDMRELVLGLKDSNHKVQIESAPVSEYISKGHIIGYVVTTVLFLFGLLTAIMLFVQGPDILAGGFESPRAARAATLFTYDISTRGDTIMAVVGMLLVTKTICIPAYTFLGLTQESEYTYPMNKKRAALYALGVGVVIFGGFAAILTYLASGMLFTGVAVLIPFCVPAVGLFVFLGLTEKSRTKMNEKWANQWITYYNNPKVQMINGAFSGALWILAIGAIVFVCMTAGWKFAWVPFVVAIALQVVLEGILNVIFSKQ